MLTSRILLVASFALALAQTAHAAPAKAKPVIAILTFDYSGKNAALEPLREGLAQMLITDVGGLSNIQVVERIRLKEVLEEHKLVREGRVDPGTAAKLGKLLGARFLVFGSYFDLAQSVRIDARVVEVETGKIVRSVGSTGAGADFMAVEQDLAGKLVDVLAGSLPEVARTEVPARAKPAKVKSTTVATYGRALLALDSGKKAEAKTLLSKVVEEAPDFRLAKSELNALLQ
jgi:TolB-like protein